MSDTTGTIKKLGFSVLLSLMTLTMVACSSVKEESVKEESVPSDNVVTSSTPSPTPTETEPEIATQVMLDMDVPYSSGAGIINLDVGDYNMKDGEVSFSYWAPGMESAQSCDFRLWPDTGLIDANVDLTVAAVTAGDDPQLAIVHRTTEVASGLQAEEKKFYLRTVPLGTCDVSEPVHLDISRPDAQMIDLISFDEDVLAINFGQGDDVAGIEVPSGRVVWEKTDVSTLVSSYGALGPFIGIHKLLDSRDDHPDMEEIIRISDASVVWSLEIDHYSPVKQYVRLTDDSFLCEAETRSNLFDDALTDDSDTDSSANYLDVGVGVCGSSGASMTHTVASVDTLKSTTSGDGHTVVFGELVYDFSGDSSNSFGYFDSKGTWTELVEASRWRELRGELIAASDGHALVQTTSELLWVNTEGESEVIKNVYDPSAPDFLEKANLGDSGDWILWSDPNDRDTAFITQGTTIPHAAGSERQ